MSFKLPSRILPSRALSLISEYSKPVTSPYWRSKRPMTTFCLYTDLLKKYMGKIVLFKPLYFTILNKIEKTDWHNRYMNLLKSGTDTYINNHKLSPFEIVRIEELYRDILEYKMKIKKN
jgi:hypothetical protein